MQIPLLDLKNQYHNIKGEIDSAIEGVLEKGSFILGENVALLEKELASFIGVSHAVGVASGTDALELSLRALGIKEKDEVITTPFTFIATAEVISIMGARPVFCDINLDDYNINHEEIRKKITKKTKAIIPVHLYGQPCDIEAIMSLAKEYNLKVIEDCAQAIGAEYKGKRAGSFGDCSGFSFFPSKNLGACGDAGMIGTKDEKVCRHLKMLRAHGSSKKYIHEIEGRNSRLDELQAAILRVKLKYINKWNQKRIRYAEIYTERLNSLESKHGIVLPRQLKGRLHIYHLYSIRAKERNSLKEFLERSGIHTAVHYPIPLHLQQAYKYLGYKKGDFPKSEQASEQVLSLPLYPEMSQEQVMVVSDKIAEFYRT
ncbi:MAG: transcriptional regulator [Candidatus Omnitrophica bacterium CG11_big_fil_rev_8_21_14_0_20_42_13]|uniref:Transcriptional regulator n=1 Tax=Candidatus Ghiorseimicrobium undicola TaxID=1974746 RepID=A0A2H0LYZ4_9BACT|nr:MAG: transcriptional regulator [Candidatus Omnitrophica bacterium CG11_big_fil_rev_8_21_14_0_20_42_13]